MISFKFLSLALLLTALSVIAEVEAATSIKVAVSFPKGSAGEKIAKTLPATTKISPCNDTAKFDAATFSVTYDAANPTTGGAILDVYFFFYNPDAANKFYSVSKDVFSGGVVVTPYLTAAAVQAANVGGTLLPYLAGVDNFSTGSTTESLFGSYVRLDAAGSGAALDTGTWQLIGILADPTTIDFENSNTWVAWDVVTVMFGSPWKGTGTGAATCQ